MRPNSEEDRQQEMNERIDEVYRLTEEAVIDCASSCNGACETQMSETVLFLPYELEYIREKIGLPEAENPFQQIELPSGRYGTMDYHRNCPFLLYKGCGIRPFRPFDCRSFPLYPRFSESPSGPVEFYRAPYCPLKADLSPRYVECILEAWRILLPHLPPDWKAHYNSVCHYQEQLTPARP